jgi:hypothetical protein
MQVTGDAGLEVRVPVKAGPRTVGVSFVRELWEPEGLPHPPQRGRTITNDNVYMGYANVGAVHVGGPYGPSTTATDTPSRRAIFSCRPRTQPEERACATRILTRMARLAYRRPVRAADMQTLLAFFDQGRNDGRGFDAGVQLALERMLVDPLLPRSIAIRPAGGAAVHGLSNLEVASRLSFFLWGSIPDDRLLRLAERGVWPPADTEREARRMLADPRATTALVNDFAAQWLNLRRVREVVVDPDRYPTYDESLLQAFERETELFVASTLREDRSVVTLLDADYTFVNERLARHYGITGVYGSQFRWRPNPTSAGLSAGSLLSTTSYPDRPRPSSAASPLNSIPGLPAPPPRPAWACLVRGNPARCPPPYASGRATSNPELRLSCGDRPLGLRWSTTTSSAHRRRRCGRRRRHVADAQWRTSKAWLTAERCSTSRSSSAHGHGKLLAYARSPADCDRPAVRFDRSGPRPTLLVVARPRHRQEPAFLMRSLPPAGGRLAMAPR